MLSKKEIEEIKEELSNSQNPLFLFDNDQDGLCSFLLLRRYLEKGKGFPVKTNKLNKDLFRKVEELEPDTLFILDVPSIDSSFWEEIEKINLPVIWIDHHQTDEKIPKNVKYYNPYLGEDVPSATTYLCQKITQNKRDLWISIAGCIADKFVPKKEFEIFNEMYPELGSESFDASEIYYNSEIGKISQILGAGLKDKTTNVIKMIKFLFKVRSPHEVLQETPKNREMHQTYKNITKKTKKLIDKAKSQFSEKDKLIFFEYGGDTSMSSELSNILKYLFPESIIFVIFSKGNGFVNISGRGDGIRKILEKALEGFENANGGGHEKAVGAKIMESDLEEFKIRIKKIINQ